VLEDVAGELNVYYWRREFLSLDAVYSPSCDSERISVVIEHENAVNSAGWEITKLAHVSVPLRVLITYPIDVADDERHLENYRKILDGIDANASSQLLVIFGTIDRPAMQSVNWRYFLYAGAEFIRIRPRRVAI